MGVKAVGILGDGEPTLHPDLYTCLAEGAKTGLDLALATNGVTLKPSAFPLLLDSLVWLRFTLCSADGKNYKTMMGRNEETFHKVIRNIETLANSKQKLSSKCTIGIQMVLTDECADQIIPLAKLGQEIGVDYFVVKQTSERDTSEQNTIARDYTKHEELFLQAETFSRDNYSVIVKRLKMQKEKRQYDNCYGCEFLPQISGAGDLYNCGNFFGNPDFHIGNIIDRSFKEIINSGRYREVMNRVKQGIDVHSQCGIGCRQNEINEYLDFLKAQPPHINFI